MMDVARIDELKRRVRQDPASISFATLAEEYRRAGQFQEAIDVCREGLRHHPAYLSARVTLGRALLEVGEYEAAQQELERVLSTAPENLAATRALEEIRRRCAPPSPQRPAALEITRIPVSQGAPAVDAHLHTDADEPALAGLEEFLEAILRARRQTHQSQESPR